MLTRRIREATATERAETTGAASRKRWVEALAPGVTVVVATFGALVVAIVATEPGAASRPYVIAGVTGVGLALGIACNRGIGAGEREDAAAHPPQGAPHTVEEVRVRCDDMVTLHRRDDPDVHLLQVGPNELLVLYDHLEDAALFAEGAAALERFPSREFKVVRELDSGSVVSISGVTEPLEPRAVVEEDEVDLPGIFHLDVIPGSLDAMLRR